MWSASLEPISPPSYASVFARAISSSCCSGISVSQFHLSFASDAQFHVVNAIGVMFHIVDDQAWQAAVTHLLSLLAENGVMIVGGDFGEETVERGVMRKNRSLAAWRQTVEALGASVFTVKRYDWWGGVSQNLLTDNLLAVRKAG